MAIAGKVAITPGYEWSVDVAYDKLVVVTYGNNVYLSTKPSTGIKPTNEEYWMLLIENVTAEDLENIINGTTPVAKATDADKVNGYTLYKSLAELGLTEATATPEAIVTKMQNNSMLTYNMSGSATQSALATPFEWGLLRVHKVNNSYAMFEYQNSSSIGLLQLARGYFNIGGEVPWSGWKKIADADKVLPLTGGTLEAPHTTPLALKNIASLWSLLKYEDTTGVLGHLGFSEKNKPIFVNADATNYYDVLHTGNKPEGTYTGNGSATSRTINTGGIGNVIFLKSASSNLGFFSRNGGVMYNLQSKTFEYFYEDKMYFRDGNLYIATDSSLVNYNGSVFTYYVV